MILVPGNARAASLPQIARALPHALPVEQLVSAHAGESPSGDFVFIVVEAQAACEC
jgi:hypothetical protein